jgi:hypothetical protein
MLRKIETKESRQKKQNNQSKLIIGLVILFLMVFSTLGYAIVQNNNPQTEGEKYGNYTFVRGASGWETTLKLFGNKVLSTSYLPREVLEVNSSPVDLFYFQDKIVYITVRNQQDVQTSVDLSKNLGSIFSRIQYACNYDEENSTFCIEANLPLKNCEDAGSNIVILIDSKNFNSTVPSYTFKDSCLTIKGEGSGIMKAADNFIFRLFRIID